jgi:V-type H+-transporting ATPase S1 subunit
MGIIVALILASVLIFGFLMLNSVQTVDRFDDPKQKQLIINAKE